MNVVFWICWVVQLYQSDHLIFFCNLLIFLQNENDHVFVYVQHIEMMKMYLGDQIAGIATYYCVI